MKEKKPVERGFMSKGNFEISCLPVLQILLGSVYCIFLIFFKEEDTAFHSISGLYIILKGIPSLILVCYGYRLLEKYITNREHIGEVMRILLSCLLAQGICYILQNDIRFSIMYGYHFVRSVIAAPLLDSISKWYELFIFGLCVPFLSCMLTHLNEALKRSLLFLIIGYFTFFTIEIFGGITLKIACYPFLNIWGYILAGWLLFHIEWKKREKIKGFICWIVSLLLLELEYLYYPNASQMEDFYFVFRCVVVLGIFCILNRNKKIEKERNILPVLAGITAIVEVFL